MFSSIQRPRITMMCKLRDYYILDNEVMTTPALGKVIQTYSSTQVYNKLSLRIDQIIICQLVSSLPGNFLHASLSA